MRNTQTHPTFLKHLSRKSIIVIQSQILPDYQLRDYYQLRDSSPKFTEKQIK